MTPVFFGRTLAGPRMPSLTYMLVHENMAGREKSWGNFRDQPGLEEAVVDTRLLGCRHRVEHHDRLPAPGGVFANLDPGRPTLFIHR